MLAELHYTAAPRSDIMADIEKVLSGATSLGQLSASVSAASSSMVGDPGTWEIQTSSAVITDISSAASIINISAKALRQPCTANAAKFKYLKLALGNYSPTPSTMTFHAALSNGISAGNLLNISTHFKTYISTNMVAAASGANVVSLVVKIAVVPGVTAIAMGVTGLALSTVLVVLDTTEDWLQGAAATNYLPAICALPSSMNPALTKYRFYSPSFLYNTKTYGVANNNPSNHVLMSFGKVVPDFIPDMFSLDQYKFADFTANGIYYDMFPVSVNSVSYTTAGGTASDYITISQTGIASALPNIWGCNKNAFGPNGNTFNTAQGLCCHFDNYMIKVM